ncbi:hypothetical protein GQ457_03G023340 [Hibiscus cannabinus]
MVLVEESMVNDIATIFGCSMGDLPVKYLGLPLGINSRSMQMWDPLIARFRQKLAGWKRSCFSFAGRLLLVNSILSGASNVLYGGVLHSEEVHYQDRSHT